MQACFQNQIDHADLNTLKRVVYIPERQKCVKIYGNQINYPITQAGKVNNLLMKTIGNKEKNEKEMAQFRQNNDEVILGIKDIKKIMNKRNKKHEEKY